MKSLVTALQRQEFKGENILKTLEKDTQPGVLELLQKSSKILKDHIIAL